MTMSMSNLSQFFSRSLIIIGEPMCVLSAVQFYLCSLPWLHDFVVLFWKTLSITLYDCHELGRLPSSCHEKTCEPQVLVNSFAFPSIFASTIDSTLRLSAHPMNKFKKLKPTNHPPSTILSIHSLLHHVQLHSPCRSWDFQPPCIPHSGCSPFPPTSCSRAA
jgi:hypothetical protein